MNYIFEFDVKTFVPTIIAIGSFYFNTDITRFIMYKRNAEDTIFLTLIL